MSLPLDPFGRVGLPADFSREGRILLIAEVADALLSDRMPQRQAAVFIGSALSAWLTNGGRLERDYLRVAAKAGSHHTPAFVWSAIGSSRGATGECGSDTVEPFDDGDEGPAE